MQTLYIAIILVVLIGLIIIEYLYNDCINGLNSKKGWDWVIPPNTNDPLNVKVEKIMKMIRHNYNYVVWRQALIIGLIAGFLVGYLLLLRLPTLYEYLVIVVLVFLLSYFVSGWFSTHYLYPNNRQIERSLQNLHDILSRE